VSNEVSIVGRSHSLEPLGGLATWGSEVVTVELYKGDRGLGFSILDYQVQYTILYFIVLCHVYTPFCCKSNFIGLLYYSSPNNTPPAKMFTFSSL